MKSLKKDTLITLVSQVLVMLLALLVNKLLSVSLGVEGFGQYSLIRKSTQVLSFVMLGGMGIALPRYLAIYRAQGASGKIGATVVASAALVGVVALPLLVTGGLLPELLASVVAGSNDIILYGAAWFFALSTTVAAWAFAYFRGIGAFMKFGVVQVLVQVLVTVLALLFGYDLVLLLLLWSVATVLTVAVALIREFGRDKKMELERGLFRMEFKTLFRYGMPRLLGDFFLFAFAAFPLVYLSQVLDMRATSYYSVGLTLLTMLTPVFSILGMVLLPWVSSEAVGSDFRRAEKLVNKLLWVFPLLSAVAVLVVVWGMEFFIKLFFDGAFLPAASVSVVLVLSLLFESIYLLLRNPIDAVSARPYNTVNLLLSLLLLVVLFLLGSSLSDYAWAFMAATAFKAVLSVVAWFYCLKQRKAV